MSDEKTTQVQPREEIGGTCTTDAGVRRWKLLDSPWATDGSCFIIEDSTDSENSEDTHLSAIGYFDGATGNVFECDERSLESFDMLGEALKRDPSVRFIGSANGNTGQLTVRQPEGNYLRICRWDRINPDSPLNSTATIRTLPQCGCGGSLGMPKLFDTVVDMCAYHFFAFYL